jgi:drug/metabolite transporter (DMT)-like permease
VEILALVFSLMAAVFYSGEIVSQEKKLSIVSPIVVTFLFGCGIMVYGMPTVVAEVAMGTIKWPSRWEWLLIFLIPIVAFLADWAHYTAIYAHAGSTLLATMYMAIPMFSSMLCLEVPTTLRIIAWLFSGASLMVLVRGRIFAEEELLEEGAGSRTRRMVVVGAFMSVVATLLYSAEIVAQDAYLRHLSSTVLATAGGATTAVCAGSIILFKRKWMGAELRFPQGREWRWVLFIPILSYIADFSHFAALHHNAGSVALSMFYLTVPIWATFMAWRKPTKWHLRAWALAAVGLILLVI